MSDLSTVMKTLLMQSGMVQQTAAATAPAGWLICDGSAISRSAYASLYAALGTIYGTGDGSTTFNIPDMRGRVAVGPDPTAIRNNSFNVLAQSSGEQLHTLTTAEMPSHTHLDPTYPGGASGGSYEVPNTVYPGYDYGGSAPTSATGGGGSHNNMQPYTNLNYIIKT